MPSRQQPVSCTGLFSLITSDHELVFIFRHGDIKRISLKAHQRLLSNSYREAHARVLNKVRFIYTTYDSKLLLLVSSRTSGSLERQEYLVQRAICALVDDYHWEAIIE